jgi:hypothetical protein
MIEDINVYCRSCVKSEEHRGSFAELQTIVRTKCRAIVAETKKIVGMATLYIISKFSKRTSRGCCR